MFEYGDLALMLALKSAFTSNDSAWGGNGPLFWIRTFLGTA